jgi:hypothetical protein
VGVGTEQSDEDLSTKDETARLNVKKMTDYAKTHLYKIVAIDGPTSKNDLENDKTKFKCLGYIKRKPNAGAFTTHPWADDNLRFAHDNWFWHHFRTKSRKPDLELWWGRTKKERLHWQNMV